MVLDIKKANFILKYLLDYSLQDRLEMALLIQKSDLTGLVCRSYDNLILPLHLQSLNPLVHKTHVYRDNGFLTIAVFHVVPDLHLPELWIFLYHLQMRFQQLVCFYHSRKLLISDEIWESIIHRLIARDNDR